MARWTIEFEDSEPTKDYLYFTVKESSNPYAIVAGQYVDRKYLGSEIKRTVENILNKPER